MRALLALVAEAADRAALSAHDQGALTAELGRYELPCPGTVALMSGELPEAVEQRQGTDRECGRLLRRRAAIGAAELLGKHGAQVGQTAATGRGPIDPLLGLESEVLPEYLQRANQAERDAIGIQLCGSSLPDQAADELAHQVGKALVLLPADVVVLLARTRLAPEGVPDRHLARAGDVRVQ